VAVSDDPGVVKLQMLIEGALVVGEARGRALALLEVLVDRGIDVPDEARERIVECCNVDQLSMWTHRAVTATTVRDLFEQPDWPSR
jgi:hypothetical protein